MKKPSYPPTTPLLLCYEEPNMEPTYLFVDELIMDLWNHCMNLEFEYYRTQDKELLIEFSYCIGLIHYWEEVLLSMGGRYVFGVHF